MTGALVQVVAQGAQDPAITGNPQITFFKGVYRRHTNFAMEEIQQDFNGSVNFGGRATATISRNGDLIADCVLQVRLPKLTDGHYVGNVGHRLIEEVDLEIGGQRVDKHYADWLTIWSELTLPAAKEVGYKTMIGGAGSNSTGTHVGDEILYVPLVFFFNRNPGLALPLIALQYHEVKLAFKFAKYEDLLQELATPTTPASPLEASLFVNYIYLDTDERRRFAQTAHEVLVDQLQFTGKECGKKIRLNFNHPVKELVWVVKSPGSDTFEKVAKAKLSLNGHDRIQERPGSYFNLVQPYLRHTRVPTEHVYCYSFALNPEEFQPSGHCNMSRIDNATLHIDIDSSDPTACCDDNAEVYVYARSMNQLRIQGGMAGLAFAN